jgi:hypothetical protein
MDKFDALGLDVEEPSRLILLNPADNKPILDLEGKEAYIDLLSTDSDVARRHERANGNRRMSRRGKTKIEELEDENNSLLAALTKGWHLVNPKDGSVIDVPLTAQDAYRLYSSGKTAWIRDQAWAHAGERANFSGSSSKTS